MRILILVALIVSTTGCVKQELTRRSATDKEAGVVVAAELRSFSQAITVEEASQDDLFLAAKSWLMSRSTAGEMDILYEDPAAGRIMAKQGLEFEDRGRTYFYVSVVTMDVQDSSLRIGFIEPYYTRLSDHSTIKYLPMDSPELVEIAKGIWKTQADALPAYVEQSLAAW